MLSFLETLFFVTGAVAWGVAATVVGTLALGTAWVRLDRWRHQRDVERRLRQVVGESHRHRAIAARREWDAHVLSFEAERARRHQRPIATDRPGAA